MRGVRYLRGVWAPLVGVPHERAGPLGSHLRDFICLLQVLGEVPELGKDRRDLDRAIRNTSGVTYTRDRQRAHAAHCNVGNRRQQLESSGSHKTGSVAENTGRYWVSCHTRTARAVRANTEYRDRIRHSSQALRLYRIRDIDQSRLPPREAQPTIEVGICRG